MWIKTLKDLILGTITSDCIISVPIHQFPSSVVRFPDQISFFRDENWVLGFEEHLLAETTWILSKSNIHFNVFGSFWANHLLFHYNKTSTDTLEIKLQYHIRKSFLKVVYCKCMNIFEHIQIHCFVTINHKCLSLEIFHSYCTIQSFNWSLVFKGRLKAFDNQNIIWCKHQ